MESKEQNKKLDYKTISEKIDILLESFSKKDLQVWIQLKNEREDIERLKRGK